MSNDPTYRGRAIITETGEDFGESTRPFFNGNLTTPSGEELKITLWYDGKTQDGRAYFTGTVK